MKIIAGLFLMLAIAININAQKTDQKAEDTLDLSMKQYDKLCKIMGGDSVRYNSNGTKAVGLIKDLYPSGKMKHKGYYDNGQIVTVFTNYYEGGQIERNFKSSSDTRGTLEVFYPSGVLKSRVEWTNGESFKWEDFYASGKPEFAEEFTRNLDHYKYMRFYYENGKPQTLFELIDEKTRTYSYTEYYENGKIEQKGNKVHNKSIDDYQMDGKWQYYDETGKLTLEEEYTHGQLINDKKY